MKSLIQTFLAGLVAVLTITVPLEAATAEVAVLEQVYERWRRACVQGDLEDFHAARDPEEVARVERKLGRRLTPDDISAHSEWIRPIAELELIGLVQEGPWAQLRYHGGDAEPDAAGARVRFHILLFHLHDDGWRLAAPGSVTERKYTDAGGIMTLEMVEIPERLRLPSQRR